MKKFAVMALAAVMLLSAVTGCGASAEGEASVQSVSMICGLGSTGLTDRFAGMVTAQSETQIKKNDNATVDAIKVKVDQEVKKGDALFTYDSSQARLDLEMAQLELEQMKNELEMKKEEKGALGMADELVEIEEKYRNVAKAMLGRILVVDNVDHAVKIARKYEYGIRMVTLEGELLVPGGAISGGA